MLATETVAMYDKMATSRKGERSVGKGRFVFYWSLPNLCTCVPPFVAQSPRALNGRRAVLGDVLEGGERVGGPQDRPHSAGQQWTGEHFGKCLKQAVKHDRPDIPLNKKTTLFRFLFCRFSFNF